MNNTKIFHFTPLGVLLIYLVMDIFCIGMGMGVPFFNILFGFFVGWYLVKWISIGTSEVTEIMRRLLIYSCIAAGVTFLGMLIIWGWSAKMLFGHDSEIANFGLPQILYTPRLSLIGWLVLMIAISPFLQLLTTVFAGLLTMLSVCNKEKTFGEKSDATA